MKVYKLDIPITKENIDEVIERIERRPRNTQKKILLGLTGGRDPITKEKMLNEHGKSSAKKLKNIPVLISSQNRNLAKKFSSSKLKELTKETIVNYNLFCEEKKNEKK